MSFNYYDLIDNLAGWVFGSLLLFQNGVIGFLLVYSLGFLIVFLTLFSLNAFGAFLSKTTVGEKTMGNIIFASVLSWIPIFLFLYFLPFAVVVLLLIWMGSAFMGLTNKLLLRKQEK